MSELKPKAQQSDVPKEVVLSVLQRVLQSKVFSHSTSLRDTLEFLVQNSLSSSPESVKEYSIATTALGRGGDFDPKSDTIVRVQMHRLREKLEEYYLTDGQGEQIRIVIPRGGYVPEYVRVPAKVEETIASPPQPTGPSPAKRKSLAWIWALVIFLVICNLALVVSRLRPPTRLPSSFKSLWESFLLPGNPPLIVYANPAFLVSTRGNFYLYDPPTILSMPMGSRVPTLSDRETEPAREKEKGPFYYFDSYTGSGELVAAARVAQFLTANGESFLIKRSRIVSYEDVKNQNVIFLGGTGQNLILRDLPIPQDLVFVSAPPDQIPMGSYIRDMNPTPGHPTTYRLQLDPSSGAIQVEYGLISLLPNVSEAHDVMVLAGITTLGTQAAADFVTSVRGITLLEGMRVVGKPMKFHSRYLQALLEVEVREGVPLDVKCLLVRDLNRPAR